MNRLAAIPLALLLSAPALAAPGGPIGTLPQGDYACEAPGDAAGPAGIRAPERDFTVTSASSYAVGLRTGSYLYTGGLVRMTSGPRQGETYRRVGAGMLRQVGPGGEPLPLRCVRVVANNRR